MNIFNNKNCGSYIMSETTKQTESDLSKTSGTKKSNTKITTTQATPAKKKRAGCRRCGRY